jgi:hypothetical protein
MRKKRNGPTLIQDLGTLAELYRTVFWLISQHIRHGRDWQRHVQGNGPWIMVLPEEAEVPPVRPAAHRVSRGAAGRV